MACRFVLLLILLSQSVFPQPRMFKDPVTGEFIKPYVQSWALIIAIDEYQHLPKLDYALSDASIMKDLLVRRFNVRESNLTMLTNARATQQGIQNAMQSLATAGLEDNVVIFFVGHARTLDLPDGSSMGYLLPFEAATATNEELQRTAISFEMLGGWVNGLRAKHVLTLVNACVGGTGTIAPTLPRSAVLASGSRARQLITAGRASDRMVGKTEFGPTPFVFKIQEALERSPADSDGDGVVRASELASYLELGVQLMSFDQQRPQFSSFTAHDGDFHFLLPEKTELVPPPVQYGSIDVRSDPVGAEILLDGKVTGQRTPGFFTGIPVGEHTILLRRGGKTESRRVQIMRDQTSYVRVTFPPDPQPAVTTRQPVRESPPRSSPPAPPTLLSPSWEFGGGVTFSGGEGIGMGYQMLARITLFGDETGGFLMNFGYGSNPLKRETVSSGRTEEIELTRTLTQFGWSVFLDFDPESSVRTQWLFGMSYNVMSLDGSKGVGRTGGGAGIAFLIPVGDDFGMTYRVTYEILNLGGEGGEEAEGFAVISLSFVFGD